MSNTAITKTYALLETATDPSNVPGLWDVISSNIPTIHDLFDDASMETAPGDKNRFRVYKEEAQGTGAGATQPVVASYIDPWTVGEYAFKFLYVPVKLPNQHLILNAGENQQIDIVKDTMAVMIRSMISLLGGNVRGIWTSGVADESDATKITGLPSIIKSTGNATGTTGGISRTNSFWQNKTTTSIISSYATNGIPRYREALLESKRGTDFPDRAVTTTTQFLNYLTTFTTTTSFNVPVQGDRFDVGVPDVRLHGLTVYPDANATANECRMINTEYMKLMLLENNYLSFSPAMGDTEKDDTIIRLRFTGNLFCPWLGAHAVVVGGDTA